MLAGIQTRTTQTRSESELDNEREESDKSTRLSQESAQAPNSPPRPFTAWPAREISNPGDGPIDFDLLDEIARELAAEESNKVEAVPPLTHGGNGNSTGNGSNSCNSPETSSTWAINESTSTPLPSRPSFSRPLSHENQSPKQTTTDKRKGKERGPLNLFGKQVKKDGFEWNKRQEGAERIAWESQSQSQASTPRASRQFQEETQETTTAQEQVEEIQEEIEPTAYDASDLLPDARQFRSTNPRSNLRPDEAIEDEGYLEEDVLVDPRQLDRLQQAVGAEEEGYEVDIMLDPRQLKARPSGELRAKQETEDGEEGYEEDEDVLPDPRQFARMTRSQARAFQQKETEKDTTGASTRAQKAETQIVEGEKEEDEHDYNELLGSLKESPTSGQPEQQAQIPVKDEDFVFHPNPDFPFDDLPPQAEIDDYDVEDVARAERQAELGAENVYEGTNDDYVVKDTTAERRGISEEEEEEEEEEEVGEEEEEKEEEEEEEEEGEEEEEEEAEEEEAEEEEEEEEEEEHSPKGKRPYSSAFAAISSSEDEADRQRVLSRRRKSFETMSSQKKSTQPRFLGTSLFSPPTSPDRFPPNRQASAGPGPSTTRNRHAAAQPSSSAQSLSFENDESAFKKEDGYVSSTIVVEVDPFFVDEDGSPLTPSEEYTLPDDRNKQYSFFKSNLYGRKSDKGSKYVRLSGPRRWTKEEELLLWRTVQRVPATQVYPLRVVWYLHGDGGQLSEKLKWFSVQHMKDKMRTTVMRRLRSGELVQGNARAWAPLGSKEKDNWDKEEWGRMHDRALLATQLERQESEKRKEAARLREEEMERRKEEKRRIEEEKKKEREEKKKKLQGERARLKEDKRKRAEEQKRKREEEKRRKEEETQKKEEEREENAKTNNGTGRQYRESEDERSEESEENENEEQQDEPQEEMDELESRVDGSVVGCPIICLRENHLLIIFIQGSQSATSPPPPKRQTTRASASNINPKRNTKKGLKAQKGAGVEPSGKSAAAVTGSSSQMNAKGPSSQSKRLMMEAWKSHAAANSEEDNDQENDEFENENEQTAPHLPARSAPFKTTAARKTTSQPVKLNQGAVTARAARKTTSNADNSTSRPINSANVSSGLSVSDTTKQLATQRTQPDEDDLTAEEGGKTDQGSESEVDELQEELELESDSELEVLPPGLNEQMADEEGIHPPLGQDIHAVMARSVRSDSSVQATHVLGTQYTDNAEQAERG